MITPLVSSNSSYYKAKENICPLQKGFINFCATSFSFSLYEIKKKTGIKTSHNIAEILLKLVLNTNQSIKIG